MNEGPLAAQRRARLGIIVDRIATGIIVTVSVTLSIMMLAAVLILLFVPSALPPR